MTSPLLKLSKQSMYDLAKAIQNGSIHFPLTPINVKCYVHKGVANATAMELNHRFNDGMQPEHIAAFLQLLAEQKQMIQDAHDEVSLVWSGPEDTGAMTKDTQVTVNELFKEAQKEVIISTYVIFKGKQVFKELFKRLDEIPDLKVSFFVHIFREDDDHKKSDQDLIDEFIAKFKKYDWERESLPDIYYYPRTLKMDQHERASLHAKCVIIDRKKAFVTSANFTKAAQSKNIEVGVVVKNEIFAKQLAGHFFGLVQKRWFRGVNHGC